MSEEVLPALHPLQLIVRADGSMVPVDRLAVDDEFQSPEGKTKVVSIQRELCKEWVEAFFSNRKSLIVTATHRFVTVNGRAITAGELTLGTKLKGILDEAVVDGLVRIRMQGQGVFLETGPNALYYTQGVLSCGS
jgi:hypothetical protein